MQVRRLGQLPGFLGMLAAIAIGCQGPAAIPPTGTLEMSGKGILRYTADPDGDVFVLDTDARQTVLERPMKKGELLVIDPSRNEILLAAKNVKSETSLKADHNYQIYFTAAEADVHPGSAK